MKSNHERSNECLPPKKREIPPSKLPSESRSLIAPPPVAESQPPENVTWLVAGGNGSTAGAPRSTAESDVPHYKSLCSGSDSMRLVSSLPAVYTSPVSQTHVGSTVHYTQLPPNLQFIASPYGTPYAGYIAPQLLPPPPPPPPLSSPSSQRLSSHAETHSASSQASKYDQQRASILYASTMPPPATSSLHHHHSLGAHYTERGPTRKEEAGAGSRELHNGGLEPSRRFGAAPEKAVKSRDAYEACQLVLPSDYGQDSSALRTSVMLMPNSHGDHQLGPSRASPGKTHLEKGSILLGKPSPVIGYITGASGTQHAPISYHTGLQQHVLIAGAQPVIIPVSTSGVTNLEPPTSQVATLSTQACRGETPGNHGGSYHQVASSAVVQAQLHLPMVPSTAPAAASSGAAAPPSLPAYFVKGSIIQLADGELKRVEELKTEDFIQSAEISNELKIDSSTVERIDGSRASPDFAVVQFSVGEHRSQVSVEVLVEYPFFVFGQGWSSCCPDRTTQLLELPCTKLSVGDVCISLTLKNMRNGSLNKTHPAELVPTFSAPTHRAPKTVPGVLRSCSGGGSGRGERQNGVSPLGSVSTLENGDLGFGGKGFISKGDPGKPTASGRKRRWSAPEGRKAEKAEEPPLTLAKPSFIPHEVKVTIEGRSNIGK
ncbi:ataxin-1a isoform X4 [Syngnathoides biaculeatus]|uniref:ataxin-1a isoform X4 n=1 Tax=Syngnathoides biaculeatus TaxID=300417 RepID=UPI002ADDDB6F|nr:ataxin-1a isoform X4 [Syngnathoides biaculeatus]